MKQPEKVTTGMQPDSAEEEQMVEKAFQNVLSAYLASNHRKKVEIIERAYRFAKEAHTREFAAAAASRIYCIPLPWRRS